jgi:hypothetical protein
MLKIRPKREEVTGEWKELLSEKFHCLYYSPDMVRVMKSRRVMWVRHVAPTGRGKTH